MNTSATCLARCQVPSVQSMSYRTVRSLSGVSDLLYNIDTDMELNKPIVCEVARQL